MTTMQNGWAHAGVKVALNGSTSPVSSAGWTRSRRETVKVQSAVHNVALNIISPSPRWVIILFIDLFLQWSSTVGHRGECNFIVMPFCSSGPLVHFLQQIDRALSRASPFAAVGVVVGTVYWSAVTYGAVTVMQVWLSTAKTWKFDSKQEPDL